MSSQILQGFQYFLLNVNVPCFLKEINHALGAFNKKHEKNIIPYLEFQMNYMTKSIPFLELRFNQITMYFIYLEF